MEKIWQQYVWLLIVSAASTLGADIVTKQGRALNIPPSQFWDGDDGPWSTFRIGTGNESAQQQFRVLPASDQSTTWLVLPEVCTALSAEECQKTRGGIFLRNESTTWKEHGQYELNTYLEREVGYDGDGLYGFDSLSLGWNGDGLPSLDNQSIAGIISPNFTLGGLALNPRPINFTDYNDPIPSLLQNLRSMDTPIPSLSWSYTAGAYNLQPKILGSLVLGGFDSTRFEPNGVQFPFGADISRDFQVAIQSITLQTPASRLMRTPIIAYISTLIPDIWLPVDICDAFSSTYGLTYDNNTEAYYVNASQHQANLDTSPIVSLDVGPGESGPLVTIDMPYWNFYLAATEMDTNDIIRKGGFRFPIRRAMNDRQYILGRAFLQSAHLIADYERSSFNISRALYPSSSTKANIMPILPAAPASQTLDDHTASDQAKVILSTAAIAGISVGGIVALAAMVSVALCVYRRRKKAIERGFELEDTDQQYTMKHEMPDNEKKYEVGTPLSHEMAGDENYKVELYACEEQQKPVEIPDTQIQVYELPAYEEKHVDTRVYEGHRTGD